MENVKICEILIKVRTNESLATNMQKANDDGPILQIYKLKSRKKTRYITRMTFSRHSMILFVPPLKTVLCGSRILSERNLSFWFEQVISIL